jgi:hypothetical protein
MFRISTSLILGSASGYHRRLDERAQREKLSSSAAVRFSEPRGTPKLRRLILGGVLRAVLALRVALLGLELNRHPLAPPTL